MALQGTLDTFALPDVLRLLAATKKSGRLLITGGRGTGSVWAADGQVVGIEATHAPNAGEPVDALFELLRFEEGAFTFDAEATLDGASTTVEVEALLGQAEALLDEWRTIESVVPSLDAWVTLRKQLPQAEVVISQDQWTTLVAVGGGATARRIADELCLGELPISRAVKELVELGLVDVVDAPPPSALHASTAPIEAAPAGRPLLAGAEPEAPRTPSGTRSRRSRTAAAAPDQAEVFVPLSLPGQGPSPSYDEPAAVTEAEAPEPMEVDDLAAAFPGLANRVAAPADVDDEEVAKQLATLSPRAASAIRAAAEATTDEEREAALDEVEEDGDQPLNRGLLLKFLSSVKS